MSFRRSGVVAATSSASRNSYEDGGGNGGSSSSGSSSAMAGTAGVSGTIDSSYKLVLVGDSGVGKSCLLEKFVNESSKNTFISTIGVVIKNHIFNFNGQTIKLQVWDTGGQQRYRPVLSTCYRNASGAIIVFDVTNLTSFTNLTQWLSEVMEYSSSIPKVLIGNKSDLAERRRVSEEEARKFAEKHDMTYIETSALESINIIEAFVSLVKQRS